MDPRERFWAYAEPLLALPEITKSTMMGHPCLRIRGAFFASYDRQTGDLLAKLPAMRVAALVASGEGHHFAPAGRTFREWVAIAPADSDRWPDFLDEALNFVAGTLA